MELIAELEREKRGVYAGAVGYFGYSSVDGEREVEGAMDVGPSFVLCEVEYRVLTDRQTCIALRTMLVKDGIAYLQAGVSGWKRRCAGDALTSHIRAALCSTLIRTMSGWRRSTN